MRTNESRTFKSIPEDSRVQLVKRVTFDWKKVFGPEFDSRRLHKRQMKRSGDIPYPWVQFPLSGRKTGAQKVIEYHWQIVIWEYRGLGLYICLNN